MSPGDGRAVRCWLSQGANDSPAAACEGRAQALDGAANVTQLPVFPFQQELEMEEETMKSRKTTSHLLFPYSLFSIANVTSCIIQQWHILFLPQIPLVANILWGHLLSSLSQNYRILEMRSWQSFLTGGLLTLLECLLWASHFIYFILLNPHLTLICEFHCSCILDEKKKQKTKTEAWEGKVICQRLHF